MTKPLRNKTAFSLIELSIVILIIGIIIAGVTQSSRLIKQFRLSSARSQTQSGPVSSIKDLTVWYETTSSASFSDREADDGSAVSYWYDINTHSSNKNIALYSTLNSRPSYYSSCINGLPCVRFDGVNDLLNFDGTFLAGVDYTIFVVEQRRAAIANYFLGKAVGSSSSNNTAIEFGYSATSTLRFGHGSPINYYTVGSSPAIAAYTTPSPKLHSFVNATIASGSPSIAHYLNGSTNPSTLTSFGTPSLGTLTSYDEATIGSSSNTSTTYFNGDIGEIIFFTRALKNEERTSVESYLIKKWGIAKLN